MTLDRRSYLQDSFRIEGGLSGRRIALPTSMTPPMPDLGENGVILNAHKASAFGELTGRPAYPDTRSFRRKFGLLIPSTNTSMEHDLWTIIAGNGPSLGGVGLHTVTVSTPSPVLRTADDLERYKDQFIGGVTAAIEELLLAQPQYLIVGMSLEHILSGLEAVQSFTAAMRKHAGIELAVWHEAAHAALTRVRAKRIGLLTPFDQTGNQNAARLFSDLGYTVAVSVGFSCANALHIAHVPDWAKERAIHELLRPTENKLDAIVQCGTNMSLIEVMQRVEPVLEIPILAINPVLLWYALRETQISGQVNGAGALLREH